jgi:hypothetical protein
MGWRPIKGNVPRRVPTNHKPDGMLRALIVCIGIFACLSLVMTIFGACSKTTEPAQDNSRPQLLAELPCPCDPDCWDAARWPLNTGYAIVVQAIDNVRVDKVEISWTRRDMNEVVLERGGSQMSPNGGSQWSYSLPGYAAPCILEYSITAWDAARNGTGLFCRINFANGKSK